MVAQALRNWRAKALLQGVFSHVPLGPKLNYFLQTKVTRGLPLPDTKLAAAAPTARLHVAAMKRHGGTALPEAVFFEFGAGWDLHLPITFYALGVRRQIVVDLMELARSELFDDVLRRLEALGDFTPAERAELHRAISCTKLQNHVVEKASCLGIDYRAPADARATGLPNGSVDCVTSTSTMEHIPRDDLVLILLEAIRILRSGGLLSLSIDYADHYSRFDSSITPYNFLRYPENRWRLYNSHLHFQNRLRHSQYLEIFDEAGLGIVDVETAPLPPNYRQLLAAVPLAEEFREFEETDLAITGAHFVLKPRTAALG